jgi:formylglycine-generating enzyme
MVGLPGGKFRMEPDRRQAQFRVPRQLVKGGSFLCAPSHCLRFRFAARQAQIVDTAMSHIGFRCIIRGSFQRRTT